MVQAKQYLKRRKYQRLDHCIIPSKSKLPVIKLGGNQEPDSQRQWKLKNLHKLKLKALVSPTKLLVKFREAYINMMLRWSTKIGSGRVSFNLYKRKHKHSTMAINGQQVDAKVVMAIYRRMVADSDHHSTSSA